METVINEKQEQIAAKLSEFLADWRMADIPFRLNRALSELEGIAGVLTRLDHILAIAQTDAEYGQGANPSASAEQTEGYQEPEYEYKPNPAWTCTWQEDAALYGANQANDVDTYDASTEAQEYKSCMEDEEILSYENAAGLAVTEQLAQDFSHDLAHDLPDGEQAMQYEAPQAQAQDGGQEEQEILQVQAASALDDSCAAQNDQADSAMTQITTASVISQNKSQAISDKSKNRGAL